MTTQSLLTAGALFLASFSMAYGTSYEVALGTAVQAGTVELAPGTYRISQQGNEAVFTDLNTGKVYETPATVQLMAAKNPFTQVTMANVNGQQKIQTIALGGHAIDLQLSD